MKLAFVGGTGPEGLGLAMRFARAGHEVAIGSRSAERGEEGAAKVREAVPGAVATGADKAAAVAEAEVVFLTFPYSGQQPTLEALGSALDGKIVCDVAAPLEFVKGIGAVALNVPGNSAAQEAAEQLPNATVVSAFQNMSAEELMELDHPIEADVLVCGRDAEAKQVIIGLANQIDGVRGIDAGGPSQSRYVEMITSLLINLNRKHKTQTSIRIVGLDAGGDTNRAHGAQNGDVSIDYQTPLRGWRQCTRRSVWSLALVAIAATGGKSSRRSWRGTSVS